MCVPRLGDPTAPDPCRPPLRTPTRAAFVVRQSLALTSRTSHLMRHTRSHTFEDTHAQLPRPAAGSLSGATYSPSCHPLEPPISRPRCHAPPPLCVHPPRPGLSLSGPSLNGTPTRHGELALLLSWPAPPELGFASRSRVRAVSRPAFAATPPTFACAPRGRRKLSLLRGLLLLLGLCRMRSRVEDLMRFLATVVVAWGHRPRCINPEGCLGVAISWSGIFVSLECVECDTLVECSVA